MIIFPALVAIMEAAVVGWLAMLTCDSLFVAVFFFYLFDGDFLVCVFFQSLLLLISKSLLLVGDAYV